MPPTVALSLWPVARAMALLSLVAPCTAFMSTAQRWPSNESGLWRPEEIALRGGAMSALWEMPHECALAHHSPQPSPQR